MPERNKEVGGLRGVTLGLAGLGSAFEQGAFPENFRGQGGGGSEASMMNAILNQEKFEAERADKKEADEAARLIAPALASLMGETGLPTGLALQEALKSHPLEVMQALGGHQGLTAIFDRLEVERLTGKETDKDSMLKTLLADDGFVAQDSVSRARQLASFLEPDDAKKVNDLLDGGGGDLLTNSTEIDRRRDKFNETMEPWRDLNSSYNSLSATLQRGIELENQKKPTGMNDIAAIFQFMKALDRMSTVREGEAAQIENTRAFADSLASLRNRLLRGDKLTNAQRFEMMETAENITREWTKTFNKVQSGERVYNEFLTGGKGKKPNKVDAIMGGLGVTPQDLHNFGIVDYGGMSKDEILERATLVEP